MNEQVVEAHTLLVLACGATGHGWRWMDHGRLSDTDTDRLSVVGTCRPEGPVRYVSATPTAGRSRWVKPSGLQELRTETAMQRERSLGMECMANGGSSACRPSIIYTPARASRRTARPGHRWAGGSAGLGECVRTKKTDATKLAPVRFSFLPSWTRSTECHGTQPDVLPGRTLPRSTHLPAASSTLYIYI
jgi:hypothetical protein